MLIHYIRWLILSTTGILFVFPGIFRVPFGTAGEFYRRVSGMFGKRMLRALKATHTTEGLEYIEAGKQYIFIGNHQSFVDIFTIQSALEDAGVHTLFMVKKELFKLPLFKIITKHMGLIPVERGETKQAMKAMLQAVQRLKGGNSLAIFAEGTRSKDGDLGEFKRGGFLLAEKSKLPIVPFVVTGTMEIMPAANLHINPGKNCHISFMPPIDAGTMPAKELASLVKKIIHNKYAQLRSVKKVVLAFGGNIGDTKDIIEDAIEYLESKDILLGAKISNFYKSKSLLKDGQADYINAVCTAGTPLSPKELLAALKETEIKFGRTPTVERWQSRTLDIDIIDYNNEVISTEKLTIPHPEMGKRSFVLLPLRDVYEDYRNPATKLYLNEMIAALVDDLSAHRM